MAPNSSGRAAKKAAKNAPSGLGSGPERAAAAKSAGRAKTTRNQAMTDSFSWVMTRLVSASLVARLKALKRERMTQGSMMIHPRNGIWAQIIAEKADRSRQVIENEITGGENSSKQDAL